MKALSIRQPWAWMILHCGKDIENREWPTRFRGRVLIHASKGMTANEYCDAIDFAQPIIDDNYALREVVIPAWRNVTRSDSRWFMGTYGFVLRNPVVLPFRPYRGALGFFEVTP